MADRLQEELDTLAVRLSRSLTVDGLDGELLAHSTQWDDADQARIASILLRHVSPERRAWEERHVGPDPTGPVAVPANAELGMSARLCVPLRRGGRTIGFLWMLDTGEALTTDERQTLVRGAEALVALLDAPARAPGREVDRLVRRLFDDGQADAADELAATVPGIALGVVRVLAAVATGPGECVRPFRPGEFGALTALSPSLRAAPGYVGSCASSTHALVVVHGEDPALSAVERAVAPCLTCGYALGVSDPAPLGVRTAREARRQALAAAELAALDPALARLAHWSALGAYRTLLATPRPPDDALRPLDEAGASAPMLLMTLEVFLDLAGDVQAVAKRLNLHRSSLYYRLDRIAHLTGVDLADGLVRLELHLALKARRVRRRTLR
jgi:PucR family transcriptional regulator, proline-responsive transcriptional activator